MPEITPDMQRMMLGILVVSLVLGIINYILTGLAIFKVSKKEGLDKPWLGWIPLGNFYQLIRLGKGNQFFLIALVAVMIFAQPINGFIKILGIISAVIYVGYMMYMYYRICDRYNISFVFIAAGSAAVICLLIPALGGLTIPALLVGMYGQFNLARKIDKVDLTKGRKIETKVTTGNKKKKK
ncbi:MAG: hypothetical protein ACRC28_12355 [Clostridium sp.]|uniref:hypothetical protein n=1 Tax=Clostridium sp. TaxID=1506 RepID=UPI003F354825